jgi:hypothetical protein
MTILVTPIYLDALLLRGHTVVKNAMADYARLPFSDKTKDYNPDIPYLGEFILNHPFQDKNFLLNPGVHLHWSFPTGLSKTAGFLLFRKSELEILMPHFIPAVPGEWQKTLDFIWTNILTASGWIKPLTANRAHIVGKNPADLTAFNAGIMKLTPQLLDENRAGDFVIDLTAMLQKPLGADYQCVPDIWLVNRRKGGQIQKTWIVESNYIAPTQSATTSNLSSVSVPYHDDRHENKSQPYRFMGRQIQGNPAWSSGKLQGENYLQEITAVGYNPQTGSKGFAELTFAAFYPNCHSVFGLYDSEITTLSTDISYEVLGLYSKSENDYLSLFLKNFANQTPKDQTYFQELNDALLREFSWKMAADTPIADDNTVPVQSILYGKTIPKVAQKPNPAQVQIAVGNTGTEALSAFIASTLPGNKKENEELLEAIQFTSKLQNRVLDIGYKFQETRHGKGFTAFPGGSLWSIKLESLEGQSASEKNKMQQQELTLPHELPHLLNEINQLQTDYDKGSAEMLHLRRQLYADWYKYMICAYPPIDKKSDFFDEDELIAYIRKEGIQPLQKKIQSLGTISFAQEETGRLKDAQFTGDSNSIASKLTQQLKELLSKLALFNETKGADGKSWKDKGKCLAIRMAPAPRFWRANDPVVLFVENPSSPQAAVLNNDRHVTPGEANVVECKLLESPISNPENFSFDEAMKLFALVSSLFSNLKQTGNAQDNDIWNPFILEWEVEYLPVFAGSNQATNDRKYDQQYINQHYKLAETEPDLSFTSNSALTTNANLYRGSTILTPHAGTRLGDEIDSFLKNFKEGQSPDTLKLLDAANNFVKNANILSQSLGGFHEALALQRQTRQLDVADPLGFQAYQSFTEKEVAPLVGNANTTAPNPYGVFNPIRAGQLKILNLRLVDNYGRTLDFELPKTINSEMVNLDSAPTTIHLNPRLVQPARLNFRFLSANAGEQEMNEHPASSPVCGWLVPNHLDRSIMFYDQDGSAIGSLSMNATNPWTPAPDSTTTAFIDSIANLYLRRVARYLFDAQWQSVTDNSTSDNSFLKYFLQAMDTALENISPENFAEHQDLAVLMGRPIAVVRAKLDLELECPTYTDQSWTQLQHELQGHGRSSEGFTKVKFPLRLGDYRRVNDGLLGYWVETPAGQLGDYYYSSEAGENPDPLIVAYKEGGEGVNIFQSIDDDPIYVTMLVDPLGSIHATTGILPVKTISLPKDQYKNALKRIAVTFLTAPVLSFEEHLKISLPKEAGYEWTWLEKTTDQKWLEIKQFVQISRALFNSKFPDMPTLWEQLVTKKWLQPLADDPDQAIVTTAVHRAYPPNETGEANPFPVEIAKRIDNFFDAYGKRIEPFDGYVDFGGRQVIREGWLQLTEVEKATDQVD